METITIDNFIDLIKNSSNKIFKNYVITSLKSNNQIHNIEFRDFEFENCDFQLDIIFSCCFFESTFTYCKFQNIDFNNTFFLDSNIFTKCDFKRIKIIDGNILSIILIDCKGEKLFISEGETKSNNTVGNFELKRGEFQLIEFFNTSINYTINILGAKILRIGINKVNFHQYFYISEDSEITHLRLYDSIFNAHVEISDSSFSRFLLFRVSFNDYFLINSTAKIDYLTFYYTLSDFEINISVDNVKKLVIDNCDFSNGFSCFSSNSIIQLPEKSYHNCEIKGNISGNVSFKNIQFKTIFIEAKNYGNILFETISVSEIYIHHLYNYQNLTFSNIKISSNNKNRFVIFESDLKKTAFLNIDFNMFNEVLILKSEVSNILLSNSSFPKELIYKTSHEAFEYKIPDIEQTYSNLYKRETYRQLKLAALNQSNKFLANKFEMLEFKYLYKDLKFGIDKLLLGLNFISNNYGQSWIRGGIFTFAISLFFYILYNFTLIEKDFLWEWNQIQLNNFKINYAYFIKSFPTIGLKDDIPLKAVLVVIFSRILIGYGIYQTIAAFRKFSRK